MDKKISITNEAFLICESCFWCACSLSAPDLHLINNKMGSRCPLWSSNSRMMAVQFGKKMGAKVIAVSKDNWIKTDFGADYIISDYDKVVEQVKDITQGKMADVVLNSRDVNTWENSFSCVGANGRLVTFGGLTGADVKLNVQSLYRKQIKLIGSNGSTRKEFREVIDMSKELKVRVWKRFKLEDAKEALQALFAKERMAEFY